MVVHNASATTDMPAAKPALTATTPPAWADAARALITPCRRRPWRAFWLLLAIGFALRLLAAFYGLWLWRLDELFQYLEQAHRVVFGYGHIPWEYRYGVRSWLPAGMAMPPLYLAKWLGLDSPIDYARVVNSWNALLSMTIPVCSYLIARRLLTEKTARWALVFTCLWYEFIVLAPRTMAEIYSTLFFMAGLAAGAGTSRKRWFAAGFLLGVALAIRPHYAPLAAIVGALWLWQLPLRLSLVSIAGGSSALLLWGLVDRLTLGGWWLSIFNYIDYVPLVFPALGETAWRWEHIKSLITASFWLYPIIIVLALLSIRQLWPLLLLITLPLALYLINNNQEYSNIFVLLPLLWLTGAGVMSVIFYKSKPCGGASLCAIAAISIAGATYRLPNLPSIFMFETTRNFFSASPSLDISYKVHDLIEKKENTVLVWWANKNPAIFKVPATYSGFYLLHLNIPVFYLSANRRMDLRHHQIWEESGFLEMKEFATHIIGSSGGDLSIDPTFETIPLAPKLNLYINKTSPTYPVATKWVYDYFPPYAPPLPPIEGRPPPKPLTPYNPDL